MSPRIRMKSTLSAVLLVLLLVAAPAIVSAQKTTLDNQKKVNKLNLLLPELYEDLEERAPQYLLEASNGCYGWSSTRPDFLSVKGVADQQNPRCESQALVKLNSIRPYDNIIWIAVTDKDTGDVMRVESKIAKVQKIEILTKLRTIDVGDLSVLEIIGYDKEGNSFSSLEGLRFEWSIQQTENIFEFITFKESKIKTSPMRRKLESMFFQTDIVVIKALQTGRADVIVKIKENGQTLTSLAVTLYAIDKFDLYPSTELYLLPQSILQYELYFTKKVTNNRITLPNADYRWSILDKDIGSIEQGGSLLTFEKKPNVPTKVVVKPAKDVDFQVTSTVTVVYPNSLEIYSREFTDDSWETSRRGYYQDVFEKSTHFVKDRIYYIRVILFDAQKNEIKITPNAKIQVQIDTTRFEILEQRNHELKVRPKQLTSSTVLSAQLVEVKGRATDVLKATTWVPAKEIKNKLNISIVMPVKLFKPNGSLHLPNHSDQIFKLHVIGGSGKFEWDSTNPSIAVASFSKVHPKSVGTVILQVSDLMNEKNFDTIPVRVSSVFRGGALESMKEVLINDEASTYGIAYPDLSHERFSNCSALAFSTEENPYYSSYLGHASTLQTFIEMLSEIAALRKENTYINSELEKYSLKSFQGEFAEYTEAKIITAAEIDAIHFEYNTYGVCSKFFIQAREAGEFRARIHVDNLRLSDHQEQAISVKVLLPFKNIIQQSYYNFFNRDEVILSMGSSYDWRFKFGPSQWESWRKINLETTVKRTQKGCEGSNGLAFQVPTHTSQGNITQSYPFTCGLCGEANENAYKLTISAQNQADSKLPRPIKLSNEITVWCNVPHALYIYPLAAPTHQSIAALEQGLIHHAKTSKFNKYHLQTEMNHFFSTQAFDSRSLPFANYSSISIAWTITTTECGKLDALKTTDYKDHFRVGINANHIQNRQDEFRRYELNTCNQFSGLLTDYIKIHASSSVLESRTNSPVPFAVNDEILIAVARNVECSPEEALLYNHKDNKMAVQLLHGSGSYEIANNATDVVLHRLNDASRQLTFSTFRNGVALLKLEDTLQIGARKIECRVQVRDPARIELRLQQDILPVGASTIAMIDVFDDQNKRYSTSQVALMDIYLESDTSDNDGASLGIKRDPLNAHKFSIDGKKRGNYRLIAVLRSGSASTVNDPRYINVFVIKSNSLDLEVFPQLEAYPPKIVFHPNCQTSLQLIGGPSDSTRVKFSYTQGSSTSSEKLFELTQLDTKLYEFRALANARGNSTLDFNIHLHPNNTLLSKVTVPILVQNIDDVKIFGMNDRTLHLSTTVRLIAQMFIQGELMTTGICPISISWVSKVEGILRVTQTISPEILSTVNDAQNNKDPKGLISTGDSHIYAVNATAVDVGAADIELSITFHSQKNAFVRTVARVDVINPVSIPVPTYVAYPDIKPSILLIPPKSGYFMPIPNPLKYSFSTSCSNSNDNSLSSDSVRVDHNGHITTGDKKGVSTQVRAVSYTLQQEIMSVHVYTTSIYSLFVENSHEVINMQVEGESTLQVRMQDFLGRSFPTTLDNVHLRVKVTNSRVLSATISDSSLLNLRAISTGTSICTVYLEANPHIYDIFFVNVGSIVYPSSPVAVHVGGFIQFSIVSSKSRRDNSDSKRWFSSNQDILTIDAARGLAKSHAEGEVIVQFNDIVNYKSKVVVQKVGEIVRTDVDKIKRITNDPKHPDYMPKYVIPFKAYLKDRNGGREPLKRLENSLDKNQINNNLVWDCSTEHPEWFQVTAETIELPNGEQQPQCIVRLVEANQYRTKNMPSSLILVTSIASRNQESRFKYVQEHKITDLIWKLFLSQNEKYVELNKAIPKQDIYIQTTVPLDVTYSNNDIRQHVHSKFHEPQSVQKIEIYIGSSQSAALDSQITVRHPNTSQNEIIRVIYDPESTDTPSQSGQSTKQSGGNFTWTDYLIASLLIGVTVIVLQSLSKKS